MYMYIVYAIISFIIQPARTLDRAEAPEFEVPPKRRRVTDTNPTLTELSQAPPGSQAADRVQLPQEQPQDQEDQEDDPIDPDNPPFPRMSTMTTYYGRHKHNNLPEHLQPGNQTQNMGRTQNG